MMKKTRLDDRGLTLLELIIGVVILAIIVTPLLHAFVTGANTAKRNKQYNDATVAAQNIVEDIQATDMSSYLNGKNPATDGSYTIIGTASSGGNTFDSVVTISPQTGSVPVSNSMDAVFQMQAVDGTAWALYQSSATNPGTQLNRYITISVTSLDNGDCKISVVFSYSGKASDSYADATGTNVTVDHPFTTDLTAYSTVTPRNATPAFALYLLFNAYYSTDTRASGDPNIVMMRTTINNATSYPFNVFMVDATDHGNNIPTTAHEVDYKSTQITVPTVNLLTNMKKVTYKVYKGNSNVWQNPTAVKSGLVQMINANRLYDISVALYKNGDYASGGDPLLSLTASKLDYSIQ